MSALSLPIFPDCFSLLLIHWEISSDQASVMNLKWTNDNFLHNKTDSQDLLEADLNAVVIIDVFSRLPVVSSTIKSYSD